MFITKVITLPENRLAPFICYVRDISFRSTGTADLSVDPFDIEEEL